MKKSQKGKKFEFKDAIKDFFDFKYLYFHVLQYNLQN